MDENKVALFLGAGASCELGMPLVWELTEEIRDWLTADKIKELNEKWREGGCGHSDETIELVQKVLNMEDFHYENLIGYIEVAKRRAHGNNKQYQDLHGMKEWFLEWIYHLLYHRQVNNECYINKRINLYKGLRILAKKSSPLWIFTLNHDLMIELLSLEFGIPIKSGFNDEYILKYKRENQISEIKLEYLSRKDIERNNLDFFKNSEYGINLIKLHGSLDIYGKDDELNYLKLKTEDDNKKTIIDVLREINEKANNTIGNYKATNHIMYLDEDGETQFLQRSILSGVEKFEDHQIAPKEFLKAFESNLNYSNILYVVGYSFSDKHINEIFKKWLVFKKEREMIILNPFAKIPDFLYYLKPQVKLYKMSFSEFLISKCSFRERNKLLKLDKKYKRIRKFAMSKTGKIVRKKLKNIIDTVEK